MMINLSIPKININYCKLIILTGAFVIYSDSWALLSEANYNLVSPVNCTQTNGVLTNCELKLNGKNAINDYLESNLKETAIELRSELSFNKSPECSFRGERIPLEITSYGDETTPEPIFSTIDFLKSSGTVLKARKNGILKRINFKIKSDYFFSKLEFSPTCLITLKIRANVPDFDNKQQAEKKLEEFSQKVLNSEFQMKIMQELKFYQPAFTIMKNMSLGILSGLNKNNLKLLGILDVNPDILQTMLSSKINVLNLDEKSTIEKLMYFVLDVQTNNEQPSEKTISDYFTQKELAIFNDLSSRKEFIITDKDIEIQKERLQFIKRMETLAKEQLKDILDDENSFEIIERKLRIMLEEKFMGPYGFVEVINDIFRKYSIGV